VAQKGGCAMLQTDKAKNTVISDGRDLLVKRTEEGPIKIHIFDQSEASKNQLTLDPTSALQLSKFLKKLFFQRLYQRHLDRRVKVKKCLSVPGGILMLRNDKSGQLLISIKSVHRQDSVTIRKSTRILWLAVVLETILRYPANEKYDSPSRLTDPSSHPSSTRALQKNSKDRAQGRKL
jgi:hypothetical protein